MIRIPLTDKLINSNIAHMEFDQNDRYVLKNCISYLRNHLVRYPSLGKETTRIVLWILGKDTDQIDKFVVSNYDADQQKPSALIFGTPPCANQERHRLVRSCLAGKEDRNRL